jgi:hypothetical protein
MTLTAAQTQAQKRAKLMGECYYVLGPCPVDGYWTCASGSRSRLWPDRRPVFTAAPDGRFSIDTDEA